VPFPKISERSVDNFLSYFGTQTNRQTNKVWQNITSLAEVKKTVKDANIKTFINIYYFNFIYFSHNYDVADTACRATQLTFKELYDDLEQYITDAEQRWKHVMRVKRYLTDSNGLGGYGGDQCYLEGPPMLHLLRFVMLICWTTSCATCFKPGKHSCQLEESACIKILFFVLNRVRSTYWTDKTDEQVACITNTVSYLSFLPVFSAIGLSSLP